MASGADPDGIAARVAGHTMIERPRLLDNIQFMQSLAGSAAFPNGSVVECGTWRGGMSLAASLVFGPGRRYFLYDSFEGLPPPTERDGKDAHWWAAHPEHPRNFDNCRADVRDAADLFEREHPACHATIVQGPFAETLHPRQAAPVALAHVDCDWYDGTYLCLERLWPYVPEDGVIVVDDYYDWEGCRRAVHDFLSRHRAREAIERVGTHGGVAIRRRGAWRISE